jgi:hypothetical protein
MTLLNSTGCIFTPHSVNYYITMLEQSKCTIYLYYICLITTNLSIVNAFGVIELTVYFTFGLGKEC